MLVAMWPFAFNKINKNKINYCCVQVIRSLVFRVLVTLDQSSTPWTMVMLSRAETGVLISIRVVGGTFLVTVYVSS